MYKYGSRSQAALDTCHKDLQKIANRAIQSSKIDIGISEGHRSVDRQLKLYNEGKSKIDGVTKKGKHNYNPSLALDIYIYHPDLITRRQIAYDKIHMAYVAGLFDAAAKELLDEGEITHKLRWGANWDSDGLIDYDQTFDDYPHFELIKA